MQFVPHIAPNQQGDESADFGVVELGCHSTQAFVHLVLGEQVRELFMNPVGDILQIRVDLGSTGACSKLCRTNHDRMLTSRYRRRRGGHL